MKISAQFLLSSFLFYAVLQCSFIENEHIAPRVRVIENIFIHDIYGAAHVIEGVRMSQVVLFYSNMAEHSFWHSVWSGDLWSDSVRSCSSSIFNSADNPYISSGTPPVILQLDVDSSCWRNITLDSDNSGLSEFERLLSYICAFDCGFRQLIELRVVFLHPFFVVSENLGLSQSDKDQADISYYEKPIEYYFCGLGIVFLLSIVGIELDYGRLRRVGNILSNFGWLYLLCGDLFLGFLLVRCLLLRR